MRLEWFFRTPRSANRQVDGGAGNGPSSRVAGNSVIASLTRLLRRALKAIGPTWAASPWRRIVQTICLALFLGLFLYVAWPYTAQPARHWPHWIPVTVDTETGTANVESNERVAEDLKVGRQLSVQDEGAPPDSSYLGDFMIVGVAPQGLTLRPREPLSPEQLEDLSVSLGPWTLSEERPGKWPSHYSDDFQRKEWIAAELFLAMDPLVSITTALASRAWVWSLAVAGLTMLVALVIPRGFCGYVCPLGTTIDLFDWAVSRRVARFRISKDGWWVRLKYVLLAATLLAATLGCLVSGFVAAIPVATRAAAFLLTPLALGWTRNWHQIPHVGSQHVLSVTLFALVLGLGLLRPRFWCKHVCPSGAVFSLGNLLRITQRKVTASCIGCNQCVEVCPFDAIQSDYTTRALDCTFCQTCGGVCPAGSIQFVDRWDTTALKAADDSAAPSADSDRRRFLAGALGAAAGAVACTAAARATASSEPSSPVRPPGSVPEREFLRLCIRCGECFQACPNSVLQPLGFSHGFDALWTPVVVADWSGCEPSCCNCGQVCPTAAIRALSLEEKRAARMGLAVVDQRTCLPFAGSDACQLCVDECRRAGYDAIEFIRVGTQMGPTGEPLEETGFLAPVVRADRCVGCGLCQTRCFKIHVHGNARLQRSAIEIRAGNGLDDRITIGSYQSLRAQEQRNRSAAQQNGDGPQGQRYLPEFLTKPGT